MSDKIPGGLAKGMSLADIAKHHKVPLKSLKAKLEQGINVEMEHTTDKAVAREIAMDHIYEDPNYYTKLKTIEKEAIEEQPVEEKKDPYAISAYALELQKGLEEHLLESMIEDNMFRSNYIDFNRLERELDYIFDDLGIDINLTQHFKDRVTQRKVDKRDIMDLMSKVHDQYSQEIRFLKRDDNRVFRHLTRLLDIASVAGGIDNDGYKDLFLKTILKRNNSSEPPLRTNYTSPVLTVNENLSSYKDYIPEINKYMSENGMEIEPYPSVKFIEDDEKNANDPLGMTAFYNPAQKCVVLYTMGRHPKDILRSYAHEMVHHEQNLKGSIGDNKIQTTNTLEDDYLDKVEREAYEKGNIMFRNWTDSLKK